MKSLKTADLWWRVALMYAVAVVLCADPLTNGKVVEMVKSGFDDATVTQLIEASETNFDTSVQALLMLKEAGVNEGIIRAMISSGSSPSVDPVTAPPQGESVAKQDSDSVGDPGSELFEDIGIYVWKEGRWREVYPEVVTLKTGGVLKSMATGGLTKGHLNGVVSSAHSRTQVSSPIKFTIVTPEGTSASEYQLLDLDEKKDRREFRSVTGGVVHASTGAAKNSVPYDPERVASRTYEVVLSSLKPGEYGFLAPGAVNQLSVASTGKIYTFGVE